MPEGPLSPMEAFLRVRDRPGVAFLDGGGSFARRGSSHLAWNPLRRLRIDAAGAVVDGDAPSATNPLEAIDGFLSRESAAGLTVIGALSYELRHWIEPSRARRLRADDPIAVLASYSTAHTFDHAARRWVGPSPPVCGAAGEGRCRVGVPRPRLDRSGYDAAFRRLQRWIRDGDIYQANLSFALQAEVEGDPALLHARLAAAQPVPYGAYLDAGDFRLISNSPELFLARRGEILTTRPIKGTRPRGGTAAEDDALSAALRSDPKELAEHVMIVDLERNDLGRVARIGSVRVVELERVVSYRTLHHLESVVSARVPRSVPLSAILRATFPGGSVTGAPKLRAIEILDQLEGEPRGFYTGGILHHPPDGNFTISVAIRTATVRDGSIRYAVGGGIVADSVAAREYEECLLKARAFLVACGGD